IIPLNTRITTHYLRLTLQFSPEENALEVSRNSFHSIGATLYGMRASSPQSQDSVKRFALIDSTNFHIQVLQTLYLEAIPEELRNACLELMHNIWMRKANIQYAITEFEHEAFLKHCIIYANGTTARLGVRLLQHMCQFSPPFQV